MALTEDDEPDAEAVQSGAAAKVVQTMTGRSKLPFSTGKQRTAPEAMERRPERTQTLVLIGAVCRLQRHRGSSSGGDSEGCKVCITVRHVYCGTLHC
jgi:hypothetical protein